MSLQSLIRKIKGKDNTAIQSCRPCRKTTYAAYMCVLIFHQFSLKLHCSTFVVASSLFLTTKRIACFCFIFVHSPAYTFKAFPTVTIVYIAQKTRLPLMIQTLLGVLKYTQILTQHHGTWLACLSVSFQVSSDEGWTNQKFNIKMKSCSSILECSMNSSIDGYTNILLTFFTEKTRNKISVLHLAPTLHQDLDRSWWLKETHINKAYR